MPFEFISYSYFWLVVHGVVLLQNHNYNTPNSKKGIKSEFGKETWVDLGRFKIDSLLSSYNNILVTIISFRTQL